jgi:hypothetical protein
MRNSPGSLTATRIIFSVNQSIEDQLLVSRAWSLNSWASQTVVGAQRSRLPQRQRWHVNCFSADTIKEFAFWFTTRT